MFIPATRLNDCSYQFTTVVTVLLEYMYYTTICCTGPAPVAALFLCPVVHLPYDLTYPL